MGGTPSIALMAAVGGSGVSRHEDLIAVLLICTVAAVVCLGVICRLCVVRYLRRETPASARSPSTGVSASIFDAPARWMAVRSQNSQAVQRALGVQHVRLCSWGDALSTPFEPRLFISPPVKGWVLVMGCDLPDPAADIDECFLFLARLSQQVGEVQFFARNRAVSHHGWARLDSGQVVRAYVWAGETLWSQGDQTSAERDLKLRCLAYGESADALGLAEREVLALNTDKVVRLAAAWSTDPTAIGAEVLEAKGIAGDLLHWKLH
jgi:hypothetical protein